MYEALIIFLYQIVFITNILISCALSPEGAPQSKKEEPTKPVVFDEAIYNWTRTFAETLHATEQKHYKVTPTHPLV